jgi:hypothetical protein
MNIKQKFQLGEKVFILAQDCGFMPFHGEVTGINLKQGTDGIETLYYSIGVKGLNFPLIAIESEIYTGLEEIKYAARKRLGLYVQERRLKINLLEEELMKEQAAFDDELQKLEEESKY